jgi:type III secretion protein V
MIYRTPVRDILLAVLVLTIAAMFLVPLPTILIDFLIALNLSFSLLLLLVSLYLTESGSLLVFPSLVLLTTLFRLSLNVASTRLILSDGDAGRVIEAFGSFLIRGNVAVGIIIFTVITIINLVVIARGSARVSEVAARFTLDALPGRQQAIDADLRAGILTPEEARQRREHLGRESQLYGSMDGAMKFIQGDAVVGIFIIIINVVGGLFIGLNQGMGLRDALDTYVKLTIGDGLVSQVPSILVSWCAGIVVTRISSSEKSTLSRDIVSQVFSQSSTLWITGILLILLSMLPGIPPLFFIGIGVSFGITAWFRNEKNKNSENREFSNNILPLIADNNSVNPSEQLLVIALDETELYPFYRQNSVFFYNWWKNFQVEFQNDVGISLPNIVIISDALATPASYKVSFDSVVIATETLPLHALFTYINSKYVTAMGLRVVLEQANGTWIEENDFSVQCIEAANLKAFNNLQYIAYVISMFFQRNPEELLSLSEVHKRLKDTEKLHPGLVSEMFEGSRIEVPHLTKVLHRAIQDKISIKDFKSIIEVVATYCSIYKLNSESDLDLIELISFLRVQKRRRLLAPLRSSRGTIKIISLSEQIRELFEENESNLTFEPEHYENIIKSYNSLVVGLRNEGVPPVSVLCPADLWFKVDQVLKNIGAFEVAISVDELDPSIVLEMVGVWNI